MGRLQPRRPLLRIGAALGVAGGLWVGTVLAREAEPPVASIGLSQLSVEARVVYRAIEAGGPFAYAKDGSVFGNRERLLPEARRGFYREYTVATPGTPGRGGKRIVCGGRVPAAPSTCYYTADHYDSFKRITP